jgi:competence protein ComEA
MGTDRAPLVRPATLASAGMERLLPWLRRSGWAYVAAAVLLALLAWRMTGTGDGGQPETSQPARLARATASRAELLVHVAGAVRRPGVYRIAGDGRVIQALRLAGGPTRRADLSRLNLAARILDGQQVVVPSRAPPGAPGSVPAGAASEAQGPVSLSSATVEQLDALDGIGPTLAGRIVEWRNAHGGFASVDQLDEVPGIGEGRLETLRDQVVP